MTNLKVRVLNCALTANYVSLKNLLIMKKVTLTFVVSDGVADDVLNEMTWGNMGNAAHILNENCEESDYDIEDYKDI